MASAPVSADHLASFEELLDRGWTDGLPVIPPTPAYVERMLEQHTGDPDQVIGAIPPRNGGLTARVAAVNAVMAGCAPAYLNLIIQAVQAMLEPDFNLVGVQGTTHPVGPCVVVSGPIAERLGVQSGAGCMGPGFRANATIGRAIRLILMNVGGGLPGAIDKATHGGPAKFTFCFADADSENPWPRLAREWTNDGTASTITVVPAEGPHEVNDHYSTTGVGVLTMVAHTLASVGSNDPYSPDATPLVVLGPEHAATVARDGFSRADVREFVAAHARTPLHHWSVENQAGRFRDKWPKLYGAADGRAEVPDVGSADHLLLAVAGGPGKHSMIVPTFGVARAVTVRYRE